MTQEQFQDKALVCVDCNRAFIWTKGEQEFYSRRGLKPVRRCADYAG